MTTTKIIPFISFFLICLYLVGCSTTYPNKNPLNKHLPSVSGKNLEKDKVTLPEYFLKKYTILLFGYKQNSQFDIDRWLLGLSDSNVTTAVYEIPTVVGMIPHIISGKIDNGMRSGIPSELWLSVITVYGSDAKKIAQFTGTEKPLNARVVLLDPNGKIIFFHDQGYGVSYLKKMLSLIPAKSSNKRK